MHLLLLAVSQHAALPAIPVGVTIAIGGDDRLTFSMPMSPNLMARIAEAMRDGALVPQSPRGGQPTLEEIEAAVDAQYRALIGRLERLAELDRRDGPPEDRLAS